jgi:hypothetical protein
MFDNQNRLTVTMQDVLFSPWSQDSGGIAQEVLQYRVVYGFDITSPEEGFEGKMEATTNIYIFGHGNYSTAIAAGAKEIYSAKALASLLIRAGLPDDFKRNIIVWTCWGGVPGGLAQELWQALYKLRGLANTPAVWGCKHVTAMINRDRHPEVIRGMHLGVSGDSAATPFGTKVQHTVTISERRITCGGLIIGRKFPAVRDDMICYR